MSAASRIFLSLTAVNSLQFDGVTSETLAEISNHLKPAGTFAIAFQPRGQQPSDEKAMAFGEKIAHLLETVGLSHIRIEKLAMEPACAICVLAEKLRRPIIQSLW